MRRFPSPSKPFARAGLTLLEVLLALAILATVLIAVSPIVDTGLRAAVAAEQESQAAVIAASRLEEIAAGLLPVSSSGLARCPENPALNVETLAVPQKGDELTSVTVTVTNTPVEGQSRVRVSLTRVMRAQPPAKSGINARREDAVR